MGPNHLGLVVAELTSYVGLAFVEFHIGWRQEAPFWYTVVAFFVDPGLCG
jgi:hypothetical protein